MLRLQLARYADFRVGHLRLEGLSARDWTGLMRRVNPGILCDVGVWKRRRQRVGGLQGFVMITSGCMVCRLKI